MAAARRLDGAGSFVDLGTDLGEVALVPATGGEFTISYDGELIWDRKTDSGFPDSKVLKQRVRDRLEPGRDLGHIDR
jgi:selenoprotein W-related protein